MSSTLSPAIVARVDSFCEELAELSGLIEYVQNSTTNNLIHDTLEAIRIPLDGARHRLAKAPCVGESYALPLGLEQVAIHAVQAVPLLQALTLCFPGHSRLALDFAGYRLGAHGRTARYIAETVVEELPPLTHEEPIALPG